MKYTTSKYYNILYHNIQIIRRTKKKKIVLTRVRARLVLVISLYNSGMRQNT